MFVTEIRPNTNEVVLGRVEDLIRNGMKVNQINAMKYAQIPEGEWVTQIRYNSPGSLAKLRPGEEGMIDVEFMSNVTGVAPGQSAVFYEGDDVIGGGIIWGSH